MARRAGTRGSWLAALVLVCGTASAQAAPTARERYSHGLELVEQGELSAAAQEFEAAYRISPNYLVLYNLGRAYQALGKPVEAVRAFEEYLRAGGASIEKDRKRDVLDAVASNEKRIGRVSLRAEPAGTELVIDGQPVGKSPLLELVPLVVGSHGVSAARDGYAPYIGRVEIAAGATAVLEIALQPEKQAQSPTFGVLIVDAQLPDVDASLDGVPQRPSQPSPVPIGHHQVVCRHGGYATQTTEVEVSEQAVARVGCELLPLGNLQAAQTGVLSLAIGVSGAAVTIDGRPTRGTVIKLPVGRHRVRVSRSGFEDWDRVIAFEPAGLSRVEASLRPTAAHQRELDAAARSRVWSYVLGGAGLSLIAGGAILYADDASRYRAWHSDRDALSHDIQTQNGSRALAERAEELQTRAAAIRGRDDLALGIGLLGGALATYAITSLLTGSEANR